jgi:ribosomal protein S18 acetylase RimI-like enzyme
MNEPLDVQRNRGSVAEIASHLRACDDSFVPPLSARVAIDDYAAKIAARAERFELWADDRLIGLLASYCNDPLGTVAFVTSVSVVPAWQGRGLASQLLRACIECVRQAGFGRIELEVDAKNATAVQLYRRHGFSLASVREGTQLLQLAV